MRRIDDGTAKEARAVKHLETRAPESGHVSVRIRRCGQLLELRQVRIESEPPSTWAPEVEYGRIIYAARKVASAWEVDVATDWPRYVPLTVWDVQVHELVDVRVVLHGDGALCHVEAKERGVWQESLAEAPNDWADRFVACARAARQGGESIEIVCRETRHNSDEMCESLMHEWQLGGRDDAMDLADAQGRDP